MARSNTAREMAWIEAWETVLQLAGTRRGVQCLLPDGAIVDVPTVLGWIQKAVYAHNVVVVAQIWINGSPGIGVTTEPLPE